MRILVVTNLYPNPLQPHRATYNAQQLAALARRHDVQIIAPIAWTGELAAWRARKRGSAASHCEPLPALRCVGRDGMVVHHPRYLFTPRVMRGQYGRFYAYSIRACFEHVVRSFQPQVVLGGWVYPDGWSAVSLAREAGLPVAIKAHGSDLHGVAALSARGRRTREALREADAVVAVSKDLGKRAVDMGVDPSKLRVVYGGVDRDLFAPGPRLEARRRVGFDGSAPLVMFAGNLVPVKGLDVLVAALHTLARSGMDFQAVLIGAGPLHAGLQRLIDSLGLQARVRLLGPRPLTELVHWYRAADVFVLPSRSEGLPNVLLEASACGTPFIASRVGGIPEIAPPDSLVPPGDAHALADRLSTFLDSRRRPVSPPASVGSWDDSAQTLAGVLEEVIMLRSGAGSRSELRLAA